MFFKVIIFSVIFLVVICQAKKSYKEHTLYTTLPHNEDQLGFVQKLSSLYEVNFWRDPLAVGKPVEFSVSPRDKNDLNKYFTKRNLTLRTVIEDVQDLFDGQEVKTYESRKTHTFGWKSYYRLNDIYGWINDLAMANPNVVKVEKIGKTHEGRDILAVNIVLERCIRRSKVFIEGGIHAREWISPAVVTYLINEIVNAPHSDNEDIYDIAHTYEWYIIPVMNPDGYEYSHTTDRIWRKNRHDGGVDLNRNFGVSWGTVGISHDRTSDIYAGSSAFSEKESKAVADFVLSKNLNIEYYIAFHSYGQYMIIPYAFSTKHWDNYDDMKKKLVGAKEVIRKRYNTEYKVGTAYDTVGYLTSGISMDWVKKNLRVPHVLTFELRDTGVFGFALPSEQIEETCNETMEGLLYILEPKEKTVPKIIDNTGPIEYIPSPDDDLLSTDSGNRYYTNKILFFVVVLYSIKNF